MSKLLFFQTVTLVVTIHFRYMEESSLDVFEKIILGLNDMSKWWQNSASKMLIKSNFHLSFHLGSNFLQSYWLYIARKRGHQGHTVRFIFSYSSLFFWCVISKVCILRDGIIKKNIFPLFFSPHRNPTPDHWALSSGLPTYVAENGLVSYSFIILGTKNGWFFFFGKYIFTYVFIDFYCVLKICNIMNAASEEMFNFQVDMFCYLKHV